MKRIAIWSSVAVLLVIAGVAIAGANARGWNECFGHRGARFGAIAYMAHQLDLSREQRQQIRSLWQNERPAASQLLLQFSAESKAMDQATAGGNLNESKVQEIAAQQGATLARLLVEKEHFRAKIYTQVLNPDQRVKADKMQSRWQDRLDRIAQGME